MRHLLAFLIYIFVGIIVMAICHLLNRSDFSTGLWTGMISAVASVSYLNQSKK